jgi:hypothetical protein
MICQIICPSFIPDLFVSSFNKEITLQSELVLLKDPRVTPPVRPGPILVGVCTRPVGRPGHLLTSLPSLEGWCAVVPYDLSLDLEHSDFCRYITLIQTRLIYYYVTAKLGWFVWGRLHFLFFLRSSSFFLRLSSFLFYFEAVFIFF